MKLVNERRLRRLEVKVAPPHEVPPAMDRLLDAIEDARREINGLPPVERPYTAADREDDIHFLEEVLPKYRADVGWQGEEAQGLLDSWEKEAQARLGGDQSND